MLKGGFAVFSRLWFRVTSIVEAQFNDDDIACLNIGSAETAQENPRHPEARISKP